MIDRVRKLVFLFIGCSLLQAGGAGLVIMYARDPISEKKYEMIFYRNQLEQNKLSLEQVLLEEDFIASQLTIIRRILKNLGIKNTDGNPPVLISFWICKSRPEQPDLPILMADFEIGDGRKPAVHSSSFRIALPIGVDGVVKIFNQRKEVLKIDIVK